MKRAKFGKVQRLALFFPDNFGDGDEDVSRISYLGFKGEWMQLGRAPANILVSGPLFPFPLPSSTSVDDIPGFFLLCKAISCFLDRFSSQPRVSGAMLASLHKWLPFTCLISRNRRD